jgi:hypothetical protein
MTPLAGATSNGNIRRIPRPSIVGRILDAGWLVVAVLALPLGILLIGAPIAFLIKSAIDLAQRLF